MYIGVKWAEFQEVLNESIQWLPLISKALWSVKQLWLIKVGEILDIPFHVLCSINLKHSDIL